MFHTLVKGTFGHAGQANSFCFPGLLQFLKAQRGKRGCFVSSRSNLKDAMPNFVF